MAVYALHRGIETFQVDCQIGALHCHDSALLCKSHNHLSYYNKSLRCFQDGTAILSVISDNKKEWQHFKLKRCHSGLFGAIADAGHAVGAVGSSDGAFSGCLPGKLEFNSSLSYFCYELQTLPDLFCGDTSQMPSYPFL